MSEKFKLKNVLFWMPLVVGGLVIGFAGIVALFVYGPGRSLWQTMLGVSIQFLPGVMLSLAVSRFWH